MASNPSQVLPLSTSSLSVFLITSAAFVEGDVMYLTYWCMEICLISSRLDLSYFLKITLELSINSQNICRRVVDRFLVNNSPSNIFWILPLLERYQQNDQAFLAATGMNHAREFRQKFLSSGSIIFLAIFWEWRMISQKNCRRVVGSVLMNMSPSNIFYRVQLEILVVLIYDTFGYYLIMKNDFTKILNFLLR